MIIDREKHIKQYSLHMKGDRWHRRYSCTHFCNPRPLARTTTTDSYHDGRSRNTQQKEGKGFERAQVDYDEKSDEKLPSCVRTPKHHEQRLACWRRCDFPVDRPVSADYFLGFNLPFQEMPRPYGLTPRSANYASPQVPNQTQPTPYVHTSASQSYLLHRSRHENLCFYVSSTPEN